MMLRGFGEPRPLMPNDGSSWDPKRHGGWKSACQRRVRENSRTLFRLYLDRELIRDISAYGPGTLAAPAATVLDALRPALGVALSAAMRMLGLTGFLERSDVVAAFVTIDVRKRWLEFCIALRRLTAINSSP